MSSSLGGPADASPTTAERIGPAQRAWLALRADGPAGVWEMTRQGLAWRGRRLSARVRRSSPRLARLLAGRAPGALATPGAPVLTVGAAESLGAAERILGALPALSAQADQLPDSLTVGVVVPTYRDTAFLADALRSVAAQTYPHWTCVVVDDASPEDVDAVVKPFRLADPRITLLRHASNGGLAAARNTALRALDADVVVFLDADDLLVPTALEHAVVAFRAVWNDPAVAGVHGQVVQIPEETQLAEVAAWSGEFTRSTVTWASYTGECPFNVHSVAVRKELLDRCGGFDESFRNGAEDWDLWFRLLRHGYRFVPHRQLVGGYRQRTASMIRDHRSTHLVRAERLFQAVEQWAELDPAVTVGRGAAAPLSRSRLALARATRAASVVGMQVASSGSFDPISDSDALALVDPVGLAEGHRRELIDAARNGMTRGLGLSRAVSARLSSRAQRTLALTAELIASSILELPVADHDDQREFDATSRRRSVDVVLLAESRADVGMFGPIVEALRAGGTVAAGDLELLCGDSGATAGWRALGVPLVSYHELVSSVTSLRDIVAVAPVGPVVADLIGHARRAGVRCHVVRVPERPPTLPVSAGAAFEQNAVDAETVARTLAAPADPSAPRAGTAARRTWRGSKFPARLPFEDGPIHADSIEKLRRLHNSRAGETVVVIGNGPSLNDTELEILTDVPTFGVNGIFLASDRFPRPITYYVVEDTSVFKENLAEIKAFEAGWKLFPAMYRPSFTDDEIDDTTVFFRMNAGFYDRKTGTTGHPRFSVDATQRLYCGQSVTIINLQLAHWMGFERVVLIGMDFNYTIPDDVDRDGALIISRSDDPNHFDPRYFGAGKSWKDPMLDRVLVNYHLVDEMYRATGRQIINATEGGKLDLFPRASLREAIGVNG